MKNIMRIMIAGVLGMLSVNLMELQGWTRFIIFMIIFVSISAIMELVFYALNKIKEKPQNE